MGTIDVDVRDSGIRRRDSGDDILDILHHNASRDYLKWSVFIPARRNEEDTLEGCVSPQGEHRNLSKIAACYPVQCLYSGTERRSHMSSKFFEPRNEHKWKYTL